LADSKTLSADRRERLSRDIVASAQALAIACATAREIDALNIRRASLLAMQRAIDALAIRPGHCLVDGRDVPDCGMAATAIIRGDATVASIAAASIVAKVARDRMMAVLARAYPHYGFERHVGYPTRLHRRAIAEFGPCLAHRLSFRLLPE
jgi:ribonuclease HII